MADIRSYEVDARSTDTFGRVLWSARGQHFIADGPVQNGCPGEAVTPAELFLAGVVACAVELVQVLAKADDVPLVRIGAHIEGMMDPDNRVRDDVNVFNAVRLRFEMEGPSEQQAQALVEAFKGR